MAQLSPEKFLELVGRSGLVEADRLSAVVAELKQAADGGAAESQPSGAQQLAEQLLDAGVLTRWQIDKLLEGRHKGFFLGKYKLLCLLGSGGMSSVYLAEHVRMQRRVAIKVLPQSRIEDSSYLARFHLEAQAIAALDHKNIVRAYDIDNDGKIHYLVMEYVDGRDLQAVVREKGPLNFETAADYIRQAAEGLEHAHEEGLVHRDIKPANLLIDGRDTVKVLDMGLARFADESRASLTIAHDENVLGTADYLAPEQAVNSHTVDQRADIYSLGCTLYFLLTGHPPFNEGTLAQRVLMHQTKQPPSILVDRPDAPKELVEICQRMMQKKPHRRYETALDVATVMAKWLISRGRKVELPSGSSNKMAAAVRAEQSRAQGARGGKSTGLPVARPLPDSPDRRATTSGDTVSKLDQDTMKGPAGPKPGSGKSAGSKTGGSKPGSSKTNAPANASDSRGGGGSGKSRSLPVARSLEHPGEDDSEFVIRFADDPPPSPAKPASLLPNRVPIREAEPEHSGDLPLWVWGAILGGAVLAIAVFIMVLALRA